MYNDITNTDIWKQIDEEAREYLFHYKYDRNNKIIKIYTNLILLTTSAILTIMLLDIFLHYNITRYAIAMFFTNIFPFLHILLAKYDNMKLLEEEILHKL